MLQISYVQLYAQIFQINLTLPGGEINEDEAEEKELNTLEDEQDNVEQGNLTKFSYLFLQNK